MMAYLPLNIRFPLAAEVARLLNLEYEYDALSCEFLFCHRNSGAIFSYGRSEVSEPGPWMGDLRSAIDILNTFPP